MLAGFLTILKVIGMILLFLICLILLLLLIVLLVPLRYSFYFRAKEKKISFGIKVTWLLKLLKILIRYKEGKLGYKVKLAFKTLLSNAPCPEDGKKGSQKEKEPEVIPCAQTPEEEAVPETVEEIAGAGPAGMTQEPPDDQEEEAAPEPAEEVSRPEEKEDRKAEPAEEVSKPEKKEKKEAGRKKKEKKKKKDKEDKAEKDEKSLKEQLSEIPIRPFLDKGLKHVIGLVKHVLPRKLSGFIIYGFDDPSLTGRVTGAAAMFYPLYGKDFRLEPDFMQKILEAEVTGSGRIRLGYFVYVLVRLMMIKEIRQFVFKMIRN